MSKILLIVGHNSKSFGVYSKKFKTSEFDFWHEYAQEQLPTWKCTRHDFKVVTRKYQGRYAYNKEMRQVHKTGEDWGADCSIEFHFNDFKNKSVNGHEILYYKGSKKGKQLASQLDKSFDTYLSNKDRGIKPRSIKERGGYGLYIGKYPSILSEPFFQANLEDYMKGNAGREKMNKAFFDFFEKIKV